VTTSTQKIVVASTNPVKGQATLGAFSRMFPEAAFELEQVNVRSGVADQPMSHAETLQGAHNRALAARNAVPQANYWVGIEGGVEPLGIDLLGFAWMVVRSKTMTGKSCTASFLLPPKVTRLINSGVEMGKADDIVFQQTDSKRKQGAAGILTHNVIDRVMLYEHALVLALIPFRNEDLYRLHEPEADNNQ
jgi:inosine/xanthosine triphosphatase